MEVVMEVMEEVVMEEVLLSTKWNFSRDRTGDSGKTQMATVFCYYYGYMF